MKSNPLEKLDVTISPKPHTLGHLHPITQVVNDIVDYFERLGFNLYLGSEIEREINNFTLLNFPPDHPARDMQATFWLDEDKGILLRTHTSPAQLSVMRKYQPPLRFIIPGRVYRYEAEDSQHASEFNHIEGMFVDKNVSFTDLKGILQHLIQHLFGQKSVMRLRPSFFPFTEPSAEVDVLCKVCSGRGCPVCARKGWHELLGAGMIHPNVLKNGGVNPEKFQGFAFGLGVERLAMLKFQISDIRLLQDPDYRIIEQF